MIRPSYVRIHVPGTKTGYENPRCYASQLKDCSKDISGEHYISHGVLKILSLEGNLEVNGFPWQKSGEWKSIPTAKMTSNILCARHNAALSPLDNVAIRFADTLNQIDESRRTRSENKPEKYHLFNGYDLERWMLKTLCGIVFSKNASNNKRRIDSWAPSLDWLKILFENQSLLKNRGLFFSGKIGKEIYKINEFEFTPLTSKSNMIDGGVLKIKYLRFILAMTKVDRYSQPIFKEAIFRPNLFAFNVGKQKHTLLIWWMHPGDNVGIEFEGDIKVNVKTI